MFDGFPCDEKSDNIESVSFYTNKMLICVSQREWSSYKADIISIQESVPDVGGDIGSRWLFRVSSDIQSSQCKNTAKKHVSRPSTEGELPSLAVLEVNTINVNNLVMEHGQKEDVVCNRQMRINYRFISRKYLIIASIY